MNNKTILLIASLLSTAAKYEITAAAANINNPISIPVILYKNFVLLKFHTSQTINGNNIAPETYKLYRLSLAIKEIELVCVVGPSV